MVSDGQDACMGGQAGARARWLAIGGLLALVIGLRGPIAPAVAAVAPTPQGLTLVQDAVISDDGRLHELTLHSLALGRDAKVRVLLPSDYDEPTATTTRYPMLLALHGAGNNEKQWTVRSQIEQHTAALGLITVMPEGEPHGFYSDWLDGPQIETFHLGELVPWIDAHYRTVGTRSGRAIVGLSMGGYGSLVYAARHPDLFVSAAEFSGAIDIADLTVAEAVALEVLGYGDDRRWGPYLTHEANWRGHNPADLLGNLRWTTLRGTTGTGVLCPGDEVDDVLLEVGVFAMHQGFLPRITLAGIPYDFTLRPCGTHSWRYWDLDIVQWLPGLMATFADPPAPPVVFDYRTTDAAWSIYDWDFSVERPAIEFLDLTAVSPAGLTARGSGPLAVATAPVYEPGATYSLRSTSAGAITVPVALLPDLALTAPPGPATTATAVADAAGRLRFSLDLGPAHTANQYSVEGLAAEALGAASYFRTVDVTIARTADASQPTSTTTVVSGGRRELPATGTESALPAAAAALVGALALLRIRRAS
jgi:S-formylglutathione hydrolase FrmB